MPTSAEARTPTLGPRAQLAQEAQTDVAEEHELLCCVSFFVRLPISADGMGGLRDRSTIDQPTRAPHHAKGTVVLPLGAQQAVSQIAKIKKSHIIRSNSRCPASAQHISSHARLPTSCHLNLRLSSFTAACLFSSPSYGYETCPSSRTQGTSMLSRRSSAFPRIGKEGD
jgi:hypothetical protein